MSLIVEDGTGIAAAESYVSADDCALYASKNGSAIAFDGSSAGTEAALRRATAYIDSRYRGRFPGYRVNGRAQGLEWPRVGAYTFDPDNGRSNAYAGNEFYQSSQYLYGYNYIASNIVPREIIKAVCEGAIREIATPGILSPDLKRGGAIRSVKAGSVKVEYEAGADPNTEFQFIDLILASLLMNDSQYSSRAMRG